MKTTKNLVCVYLIALCSFALAGCSGSQSPSAANEIRLSLRGIPDVTISYDEEPLTFYQTTGDELIIKEYMTKNKSRYYAKVKQSGDSIHISEGSKPFFKSGFSRRIEVYLPVSYLETLKITTTDGDIDLSNVTLRLTALRIDSTAGTVDVKCAVASSIHLSTTKGTLNLGSIEAESIRLDTTSGNVSCDELIGNVEYTSTSGNADIKSAVGSGSYRANNSGRLNVNYAEVTGDLYLFNKNEDIHLTLPPNLSFEFEATTKNGSISTTFGECIAIDGRTTRGTVGSNPTLSVKTETTNGKIDVSISGRSAPH